MNRRLLGVICLSGALSGVAMGAVALAQPATDPQPTKSGQQEPPQAQQGSASDGEPSPADRARRAKVVAKVGDARITVGDVEDEINQQSPFLRARYREPAKLQEFVQNMIRFELLARAAQKQGYADNESVVQSVKQNAVQHLIRTEFDERITPESLPAEDVRAYYDANEPEFRRSEMVRASHILVDSREEATRLLEQLKEGDARAFRQAAREHSIDSETKLRGGDLRYFTRDGQGQNARDAAVNEAIVQAALGLQDVGDLVDEPIQVGDDWSIVKLTGRRQAEHRGFEEAEQGIRLRLWRERRQEAIEAFVAGLRQRYRPEIAEDRMAPIRLEAPAEQPPGAPEQPSGHGHDDPQ